MSEGTSGYDVYEWVKARVSPDLDVDEGEEVEYYLTVSYQVPGLDVVGTQAHDEDVADYSEDDIKELVSDLIGCDPSVVEVVWE